MSLDTHLLPEDMPSTVVKHSEADGEEEQCICPNLTKTVRATRVKAALAEEFANGERGFDEIDGKDASLRIPSEFSTINVAVRSSVATSGSEL